MHTVKKLAGLSASPDSGRGGLITLGAAFLAAAFAISLRLPAPLQFVQDQDWAQQLAGANQILRGLHPFIDYLPIYGPLTFYTSALAQSLSGTRIIGELLLCILGFAAAYTLLFWVVKDLTGDGRWALVFLFILVFLVPRLYKYYIVLGPALSLFFMLKYVERPSYAGLWLMGLATVITGLFRADFGVYMAISAAIGILSAPGRARERKALDVLGFAVILFIIASPWLIFLAVKGGLLDYLYASTAVSFSTAAGMSTSFSFSQGSAIYSKALTVSAFLFLLIPALAVLLLFLHRHDIPPAQRSKLLVLAVASQLTLIQTFHRSDFAHLLQAIPVTLVLMSWLVAFLHRQLTGKAKIPSMMAIAAAAVLLGSLLFLNARDWRALSVPRTLQNASVYSLERGRFMDTLAGRYKNNATLAAMSYVRSCTEPSDRIIPWPLLPNFYYFTDRPFGSRLMTLAPGYYSSRDQQRQLVQDLEQRQVPVFIYRPMRYTPQATKIEDYAPVVADYLKNAYVPSRRFGNITVFVNRSLPGAIKCPGK